MSSPSSPTLVAISMFPSPERNDSIRSTCCFGVRPLPLPRLLWPMNWIGLAPSRFSNAVSRAVTESLKVAKTMIRDSGSRRSLSRTSRRTAPTLLWISPISARLARSSLTRGSRRRLRVFFFSESTPLSFRSRNSRAAAVPWQRRWLIKW